MINQVWFCSTKGNDDNIKITFCSRNGGKRQFNKSRKYEGLTTFIEQQVDTIVSMEYSIIRLYNICQEVLNTKKVKVLNLMAMFRELLILHTNDDLNRAKMMTILGYDIKQTEPDYPRSYGDQTCLTYQVIYLRLQELSDL